MSYRIAGIDVHKKMMAVVVSNVTRNSMTAISARFSTLRREIGNVRTGTEDQRNFGGSALTRIWSGYIQQHPALTKKWRTDAPLGPSLR